MTTLTSEVLVVGGGAAGLSAAVAAADRASVTIVDDNPRLGGQIWRAELGKIKSPQAREIVKKVENGGVTIINDAQVFASASTRTLLAETPGGRIELEYEKLIIATGARERFLPFPGWTLPGVFGAGGLQSLVKGGLSVKGKRVVVAGTGPLLFAVADHLRSKGAKVPAIAEQTPASKVRKFGLKLVSWPSKLLQAASIRSRLIGSSYLTDCWVVAASGVEALERVTLTTNRGRSWSIDCDYLACGFHLVPNTELAEILGCRIADGVVAIDEYQTTSVENVYCAGEPTGIAGIESSLIEGTIAGLAATGRSDNAISHFASRDKARRFGDELNQTFALRNELKTLAQNQTVVCRCEDVTYGRLSEYTNSREAKLQTRCGMGPCQGRICGSANEFLFGWTPGTARPPIFPVRMENL